jgi:hypothetical protein
MMHNIRKFLALDGNQMRLFIEAYATLGVVRIAILTLPFKRLAKSLDQQKHAVAPPLDDVQLSIVRDIGEAIRSAANNTPWESLCLAQALAVQRMLSKRGIRGVFHLGAAIGKSDQEKLKAHAWLLCGGRIITGEAGHEQFAVLSTYRWEGGDGGLE